MGAWNKKHYSNILSFCDLEIQTNLKHIDRKRLLFTRLYELYKKCIKPEYSKCFNLAQKYIFLMISCDVVWALISTSVNQKPYMTLPQRQVPIDKKSKYYSANTKPSWNQAWTSLEPGKSKPERLHELKNVSNFPMYWIQHKCKWSISCRTNHVPERESCLFLHTTLSTRI